MFEVWGSESYFSKVITEKGGTRRLYIGVANARAGIRTQTGPKPHQLSRLASTSGPFTIPAPGHYIETGTRKINYSSTLPGLINISTF